jgi:hypothetical protein
MEHTPSSKDSQITQAAKKKKKKGGGKKKPNKKKATCDGQRAPHNGTSNDGTGRVFL